MRSRGAVSGTISARDQRAGANRRIRCSESKLMAHLWGVLCRHRPVVVCAAYAELLDADIVSADIVQTVDQHIKAELVSSAHVHAATRPCCVVCCVVVCVRTNCQVRQDSTRLRAHLLQIREGEAIKRADIWQIRAWAWMQGAPARVARSPQSNTCRHPGSRAYFMVNGLKCL